MDHIREPHDQTWERNNQCGSDDESNQEGNDPFKNGFQASLRCSKTMTRIILTPTAPAFVGVKKPIIPTRVNSLIFNPTQIAELTAHHIGCCQRHHPQQA